MTMVEQNLERRMTDPGGAENRKWATVMQKAEGRGGAWKCKADRAGSGWKNAGQIRASDMTGKAEHRTQRPRRDKAHVWIENDRLG